MSLDELAVCVEKRRVTRSRLIQQIGRLNQFRSRGAAKACQKKIFGASVELEGSDVARRGTFDCVLFAWRKLRLQLSGNGLRDLTLNREYVRKVSVIGLRP